MSPSSNMNRLQFVITQIDIYGGLFLFVIGIFGEILNLIIFTTLKTFRRTTCAFYLIVASIANIGVVIIILLRILYDGFHIDSSNASLLCKIRYSIAQYFFLISVTSMSLATIDQFLSMTQYRQWSNLSNARHLIALSSIIWFIYSICTFLYYDSYLNACIIINPIMAKYYAYFHLPIILGILPLSIMITFSLLAYFKIRTIASRQINLIRLSRDRQLTAMTLLHILLIVITTLPFTVFLIYVLILNTKDPNVSIRNQVIYTVILHFYDMNYSCSFYIYCCVSRRFRRQVIYVLFDIYFNRWRRRINNINNNQVMPHPIEMINRFNQSAQY